MDHEALLKGLKESSISNRRVLNAGLTLAEQSPSEVELESLQTEKLRSIVDLLWDRNLNDLIHEGKLTLAGIKPNTQDSKLGVESDDEGAEMLESMIDDPLEIVFSVSLIMEPHDVEAFYGKELVEDLRSKPLENTNVWDNYCKKMTSGPATFMLVYSEGGDAVRHWRKKIGPTNLEKARNEFPESIRGRYARASEKNLVHGSSGDDKDGKYSLDITRENVTREIEWLRSRLTSRLIQKEKQV